MLIRQNSSLDTVRERIRLLLLLWLSWSRIHLHCRGPGFDPWVGKIRWRRKRLSTPVFWPRELHGLYSPWGRKESGHNSVTFTFTFLNTSILIYLILHKYYLFNMYISPQRPYVPIRLDLQIINLCIPAHRKRLETCFTQLTY